MGSSGTAPRPEGDWQGGKSTSYTTQMTTGFAQPVDDGPFTLLEDEELCEACFKVAAYQKARQEVGLDYLASEALCSRCAAVDHARRRELWSFDRAAQGWDELVVAAENRKVRVPVRMLLPNGTVVDVDATLTCQTHDEHGNTLRMALYCRLSPNDVVFLASAQHYPLRTASTEEIKSLPLDY